MNVFIVGNVITFATTFFDITQMPVNPASVQLTIRPMTFAAPTEDPIVITMTRTDTVWSADWDTFGIAPGTVFWSVQATDPHAADQGSFVLTGNWANAA